MLKAIEQAKNNSTDDTENWFIARAANLQKLTAHNINWVINAEEEEMRNIWIDEDL